MRRISLLLGAGLLAAVIGGCGPAPAPDSQQPTVAATAVPTPAGEVYPTTAPTTAVPQATAAPPAPTAAPAGPERISFAPGASSGMAKGAVVRGEERRYVLGARAGQQMRVQISALEQNAVFAIFDPAGKSLAGAEPGADATDWAGALPADGDYQIAVGPTRGNATFELSVSIVDAPARGSIRSANWAAVIAGDPMLERSQGEGRTYVAVRGAKPGVGGYPLLDSIVYADMDGDGAEEAAITLESGGTAGNIGFLVYRQAGPAPTLAAWRDGYKLGLLTENGRLVLRSALYAGWEPNCCPSGFTLETLALAGDQLQVVDTRQEGFPEMQVATVEQFYTLIGRKDLAGAYAMLSDAEHARTSFEGWQALYADTIDEQATLSADPGTPNVVRVATTITRSSPAGGQVKVRFEGSWTLEWGGVRGWVLSNPQFVAVG